MFLIEKLKENRKKCFKLDVNKVKLFFKEYKRAVSENNLKQRKLHLNSI